MFAKCFSWTHFKKKFSDKILYCDVKQATQGWPLLENTDKIHSNNLALEIQFEMCSNSLTWPNFIIFPANYSRKIDDADQHSYVCMLNENNTAYILNHCPTP